MVIQLGIVGLGYWGPNLLRNFSELPDSEVVAVCDKDQKKLESAVSSQKRYRSVIKATTSIEDLLSSEEVNAVVISTPTKTHYDLSKAALEHGKHVLVEKPLTFDPQQSLELMKLAQKNDLTLMVGHIFLYNSVVQRMKEEVDSGNLGNILYMSAVRTGLGPIRQDVNAMWDLAPHDISIFNYLLGSKPRSVFADGRAYVQQSSSIEDVVFMTLDYQNGVVGGVHVSWIDPVKTRRLTVVGTKKMIVFDDASSTQRLAIYDKGADYQPKTGGFGEFQLSLRDGDIVLPRVKINEPLRDECAHFLHCIKTGEVPMTDGRNGYEVVAVLDAAQKSLKEGTKVSVVYK